MTINASIGDGAQWSNIGTPVNSTDSLTLVYVLLMLALNTFLCLAISLYVENVLPKKFGVRKPWYYIFQVQCRGFKYREYLVIGECFESHFCYSLVNGDSEAKLT